MPIAFPASQARRSDIADQDLIHVSPSVYRDVIIAADRAELPAHANCCIHLKAGQGWSVAPFRLLRDYSVLDPWLTNLKDYGCYTYFFLGAPGVWARTKNIGLGAIFGNLGDKNTVYSIRGADVLACAELIFYRPDDRVIVIRGDYRGPAWADPAP